MAKKRGKSKAGSMKSIKKAKAPKKQAKKISEVQKPINEALHELEILAEDKKTEASSEEVIKEETPSIQSKTSEKIDAAQKTDEDIITEKPSEKVASEDLEKEVKTTGRLSKLALVLSIISFLLALFLIYKMIKP